MSGARPCLRGAHDTDGAVDRRGHQDGPHSTAPLRSAARHAPRWRVCPWSDCLREEW